MVLRNNYSEVILILFSVSLVFIIDKASEKKRNICTFK